MQKDLKRKAHFKALILTLIFHSFTREKVRQMLEFIIKEPQANEADQVRGHSIPFHSDMVFQFGKEHINGTFFRSEAQDRLLQS